MPDNKWGLHIPLRCNISKTTTIAILLHNKCKYFLQLEGNRKFKIKRHSLCIIAISVINITRFEQVRPGTFSALLSVGC